MVKNCEKLILIMVTNSDLVVRSLVDDSFCVNMKPQEYETQYGNQMHDRRCGTFCVAQTM